MGKIWLALEIGNSRLHWALFIGKKLYSAWNTHYLAESVIQQLAKCQTLDHLLLAISPPHQKISRENTSSSPPSPLSPPPLLVASVVPSQTAIWQTYPNTRVITLDQVSLKGVYPTLGIDRALALWGAGKTWGFPMLVIDAGTALTFTAADANQCLVGGAILPGLGLQFATLGQQTGQLPLVEMQNFPSLPSRFALNTTEAIQSGVVYTILAGIKDFIEAWWQLFPNGRIAIKGGDRTLLLNYLQTLYPEIAARLIVEQNLIFWGMREIVMEHKE
ncbi:Baf family transcriptional activator [Nostoc commune NIES-4072]|uniref:Type III pantothenate kinase n=1 Tax=Nostoc commune NIES-4072 TaxID=2005467 RepID=A0A2R5FN81_NOSCO|nr:Baf family transcriptional activator [Nostoc commune HK-02]GBG20237.1 Baf family transcriptional activator [Nostoc commune NIES-4072]